MVRDKVQNSELPLSGGRLERSLGANTQNLLQQKDESV